MDSIKRAVRCAVDFPVPAHQLSADVENAGGDLDVPLEVLLDLLK